MVCRHVVCRDVTCQWPWLLGKSKGARGGLFSFNCVTTALLFLGLMEVQKAPKDRVHIGKWAEGRLAR